MSGFSSKLSGTAVAAGALALALSGSPQARAQSPCGNAVTVSPGDTLYRIAQECGTTVSALMSSNPRISNPNYIEVGQRIAMPGAVAGGAPRQARGLVPGGRYIVRPGDTLYAISRQFGIPLQVLLGMNPQIDPRYLRVGIDIRLPGDRDRPDRDRDDDRITVTGVITGEGVECPTLRSRDGELYSLAGDVGDLEAGDRVQVQGRLADVSFCMQGTTIEVRRYRARG